MKNSGWAGKTWYCPFCGNELKSNDKTFKEMRDLIHDDDYDAYDKLLDKKHDPEIFLCINEKCVHHSMPLNLFHPVQGHNRMAGDSWAIGFIK